MNVALARALRQGVQLKDPRLYDLLGLLIDSIAKTDTDMVEVGARVAAALGIITTELADVSVFNFQILPRFIRLTWEAVTGAVQYEVRKGSTWSTATYVTRTPTIEVLLDPLTTGSHTYLIKSMDINGNYCVNAKSLTFGISSPTTPSITTQVIDNYGLIYWTASTADFEIAYYQLKKGGNLVGNINGTFTIVFEIVGGTYSYSLTAYDVAGNAGAPVTFEINLGSPRDYVLEDEGVSAFGGTKTNCVLWEGSLWAPTVDETFEEHFTDRSWDSIQDQLDAGYPLYIQPTNITAEYTEDFDFGAAFNSVIANVNWSVGHSSGVTIVCKLKTSEDGISWSAETTGQQIFGAVVRYVRVHLEFTGASDTALIQIIELKVSLAVSRETDSGSATANSGDAGGTIINFNKSFKDIDSINVSVKTTNYRYIAVDFTDAPNPDHFHVLVFDSGGTRVTETIYWIAKGVI